MNYISFRYMNRYLNSNTPNEVRNEAMLIHSDTDFTLFSLMVL